MTRIKAALKSSLVNVLDIVGRLYTARGVPILCYHSIDETGSILSISSKLFSEQMHFLAQNQYRIIALRELCESLREGRAPPQRAVVLTFDDGFKNFAVIAAPVLLRLGFTATVFLASGFVGKSIGWTRTDDVPALELLSWNEVRQLADNGFDIGSHSVNHPNMCALSNDQIRREIEDSKSDIEDRIGRDVALFAYPFGEYDERVRSVVEEAGFLGAVTLVDGRVRVGDDVGLLKRVNVTGISGVSADTKLAYFRCCVTGTATFYTVLKQRMPMLVSSPAPWRDDDERAA